MKAILSKVSLLTVLIIPLLGYATFSVIGCDQGKIGGIGKMPFQDLGISDGENELFYAGIINIRNYRAIGNGTADDTSAINRAIQNAGNNTLLIPSGTYRIASSLTIPNNVNIYFANGAKIKPDSGKTLTINGRLIAERYQIFEGDGTVSITKGACDEIYPEWWGAVGDGSTDDTVALQKCIDCASSYSNVKVVRLGEKTYKITSALTTGGNAINIIGTSMNRSWILVSGGCDGLRITPYATGSSREQILLSNFRIYSDSVVTGYGIYISGHRDLTIDHVWIGGYYDHYKGFEYGIYALNQPTYYLRILNSRIFYCKYGIYITGTANNAVIEHNTIRYGARLITLGNTSGTRIINNSIETDSGAGNGGNPSTERLITLTGGASDTVIANNYLEHHGAQTIELQSGCTRTRIYGNTKAVWLYDQPDVLDNSGNYTNSYDNNVVFRVNKDTNNYYTDNVGGIIDVTLGNVSDYVGSGDWHPADFRIRARKQYLVLRTEGFNKHIELGSHTDGRTFNTPFGGFGKVFGNYVSYSEAFSKWSSLAVDNVAMSPTGEMKASRALKNPGYTYNLSTDTVGTPFTDGKIVNFSVWLRSPAGKAKGGIAINYHAVCELDIYQDWRRYNVPAITYMNSSSPYNLNLLIAIDPTLGTLELFGAQLTINGTASSGTVTSKVSPTTTWMMDTSSNLKAKGADVGAYMIVTSGSSRGFVWITDVESCIDFSNGNGTQPSVGDTVTGSATYGRGVITQITVTSGSFSNGNAVGWIRIKNVAGNFANGNTLTFPNATATVSAFYLNSVVTFVEMGNISGGKTSCANGDTYYIAPRELLVPQPYVATNGTPIACVSADFYSDDIGASAILTNTLNVASSATATNLTVSSSLSASTTTITDLQESRLDDIELNQYAGTTLSLVAGENLSFGDVCYMDTDNTMKKADADSVDTSYATAVAMQSISSGSTGVFLVNGIYGVGSSPLGNIGRPVYLSTTAGSITSTAPSGSGQVVQILGNNLGVNRSPINKPPAGQALKTGTWHTQDLVAFWSIQETSGTTLNDIYGSYNATLYNFASPPTETSGWNSESWGRVLAFDGSNDYCQTGSTFPISTTMTIALWLKNASTGGSWRNYIRATDGQFTIAQIRASRKVEVYDNTSSVKIVSNTVLTDGVWYHIVLAINGTNASLYINGQLDNSTSNFSIASGNKTIVIGIGAWGYNPFSGRMADIRIWSRTLNTSEIAELYSDRWGIYFPGNKIYFNPNQKIEVNP